MGVRHAALVVGGIIGSVGLILTGAPFADTSWLSTRTTDVSGLVYSLSFGFTAGLFAALVLLRDGQRAPRWYWAYGLGTVLLYAGFLGGRSDVIALGARSRNDLWVSRPGRSVAISSRCGRISCRLSCCVSDRCARHLLGVRLALGRASAHRSGSGSTGPERAQERGCIGGRQADPP